MKVIESNLPIYEFLNRLRKGHAVRRKEWSENYFVRICNEDGFDEDGNAYHDPILAGIYITGTDGYFHWLGHTKVNDYINGLDELWAEDWEDAGFISKEDFDEFTEKNKVTIRMKK